MFVSIYDSKRNTTYNYSSIKEAADFHPLLGPTMRAIVDDAKVTHAIYNRQYSIWGGAVIQVSEEKPVKTAAELWRLHNENDSPVARWKVNHPKTQQIKIEPVVEGDFEPITTTGSVKSPAVHLGIEAIVCRNPHPMKMDITVPGAKISLEMVEKDHWGMPNHILHHRLDHLQKHHLRTRYRGSVSKPGVTVVFRDGSHLFADDAMSLTCALNRHTSGLYEWYTNSKLEHFYGNGFMVHRGKLSEASIIEMAATVNEHSEKADNAYVLLDRDQKVVAVSAKLRNLVMCLKGAVGVSKIVELLKTNDVTPYFGDYAVTTAALPIYYGQHASELHRFTD